MNDKQRAKIFREAKQQSLGFLSRILWQLSQDREMFAEAMHCALFSLWRYVDQLRGGNNPRLLYRIALSANADAWQRRQQQDKPDRAKVRESREKRQLRQEIAQAVRQAIAELPLKQSQAVVMRYIEKRPWRDIADTLKTTDTRVQRQVEYAVRTLREKVSSDSLYAA